MNEIHQQAVREEGMTLRDLLLIVKEWWKYLLSNWLILVIFGFVGGGLGLTYAWMQKPKYVGELTFIVEEGKSNVLGAYAGIASQFGIDLGGSSGLGVFSGDNIMEFLKSRLLIEKTLLSTVTVDGKKLTLAEFYIDIYGLREGWKKNKNKELQNVHFVPNGDRMQFTRLQDSVLNILRLNVVNDHLSVDKPDKKLSFISVNFTSLDETLSKAFIERLVKEAITFYIDTKTLRNKVNIERLQSQADSIEILLNRKTYTAAAEQDLNLNPARQSGGVRSQLVIRDKVMLETMYGEVVKNLELSKIAMAQETPVIQIVDTPILPLKKKKLGRLMGMLGGGFLLGFFGVLYLILKKLLKE